MKEDYQPEINVTLKKETDKDGKDWVVITFEDNGICWDWHQMPERVWEKYYRSKKNIEGMGGTFDYKAEWGKGAIVTTKIPAERYLIKKEDD